MRLKRSLFAVAIAGALLAPSAAQATTAPHYKVDAHDDTPWRSGGFDYAGSTSTAAPLTEGVWYVAEVQGTVSYYKNSLWKKPTNPWDDVCGSPLRSDSLSAARFLASPGVSDAEQGYVGMDAETIFARPCINREGGQWPQPGRWTNFEINDGTGYRDYEPTDGPHSVPTWSNAYDYAIVGKGVPAKFRFRDLKGATKDNYGRLDVYVRPATFNDCWVGGAPVWRAFGFDSFETCWHGLQGNPDADTYVAAAVSAAEAAKSRQAARR